MKLSYLMNIHVVLIGLIANVEMRGRKGAGDVLIKLVLFCVATLLDI